MTKIILTQGKYSKINDNWYEYINKWKWYAFKDRNKYYAARSIKIKNKVYRICMHHIIWELMENIIPIDNIIDHKDGDGLNNYDDNLRLATRSQNRANTKIYKNNTSGYIGVYKNKFSFVAYIKHEKLGSFSTAEMAARVRDYHAIRLYGEFAVLNFQESRELYKF